MNDDISKKTASWACADDEGTIPSNKIHGLDELISILTEPASLKMMFTGDVARLVYGGKAPFYATEGSAGIDLRYAGRERMRIPSGWQQVVPTGVCIHIKNERLVGKLHARSGNAARLKIRLANGTGVIDSDYIKEIGACLVNDGDADFWINPGDRICQLVIEPVVKVGLRVVSKLEKTTRDGGFGSTGDK